MDCTPSQMVLQVRANVDCTPSQMVLQVRANVDCTPSQMVLQVRAKCGLHTVTDGASSEGQM